MDIAQIRNNFCISAVLKGFHRKRLKPVTYGVIRLNFETNHTEYTSVLLVIVCFVRLLS